MTVQFLEYVTPNVDTQVDIISKATGLTFTGPVPEFGNAMVAIMPDGGKISVRAPMHETETPVIRPYLLTKDIALAVKDATDAGAEIMHPPLEIPGQGTFAIYRLGGLEQGLWEV